MNYFDKWNVLSLSIVLLLSSYYIVYSLIKRPRKNKKNKKPNKAYYQIADFLPHVNLIIYLKSEKKEKKKKTEIH